MSQDNRHQYFDEGVYREGDLIHGEYKVLKKLGGGGFGIVYLVYSKQMGGIYALKTIKPNLLIEDNAVALFRQEINTWIELEKHPNIVHAYVVHEMEKQFYIVLEYVDGNPKGFNSFNQYINYSQLDLKQCLHWVIEICFGLEFAYSKGIIAHRDIKPANIMISNSNVAKITDFGISRIQNIENQLNKYYSQKNIVAVEISRAMGTPLYMAPEQFDEFKKCDERSDIYSLGIILFQMASGGEYPYNIKEMRSNKNVKDIWSVIKKVHRDRKIRDLNSPLFPIIQKCMKKNPNDRYATIVELRKALELILFNFFIQIKKPPNYQEMEAWEWSNKGVSYQNLGRHEEAIQCFKKALELGLNHEKVWTNMAMSLNSLMCYKESIECSNNALDISPKNTMTLSNMALTLNNLGLYQDAIKCCDKAIEIDKKFVNPWVNKGISLRELKKYEEAIECFMQAIELDPKSITAWTSMGAIYQTLWHFDKAILCFKKSIEINPRDIYAWYNKAIVEKICGDKKNAINSFKVFLSLATPHFERQIDQAKKSLQILEKK